MAAKTGKSPLETLKNFRARQWFDKEFKAFALRIATEYAKRNEVVKGCVISAGGGSSDGATNASRLNLDISAGAVKLNGVQMSVGALNDKEAADGSADGAVSKPMSKVTLTATNVPTFAGNNGEFETFTLVSGGKTLKVRFYDPSDTSHPGSYDTGSDANVQIDVAKHGLNADQVMTAIKGAADAVFTTALGYSSTGVGSGAFTITAPTGSGNDFVYTETGAIGNLSASSTVNYTYSFGGMIKADGSADIAAHTADSVDYYLTFIASNSDGVGGANTTDGSSALVHGISSTTAHLQTDDINAALAASSGNVGNYDHSGVTGWVHLAQIGWASSAATITLNRNNAVSKA